MDLSDLTRFQQAQAYFRRPNGQGEQDRDLAEAGSWLEQLCILLIGRQVRGARKKKQSFVEEGDRINEVWVNLLRKLPRLKYDPARASLTDWLTKIIDRILIGFTRRRRSMESLDAAAEAPGRDESITIKQAELARELRAALAVLRSDLPAKNLELIELHWLEGRKLKDAAEQLELTENKAWCRQRRTLCKLRELLPLHSEWPCLAEWIENHFPDKKENHSRMRDRD
jgi:RNA polymerase sigma factor (sigma-70 family)